VSRTKPAMDVWISSPAPKTPQPFCLLRINPKEIMVAISWEHIPVIQNTMKIEETQSTDS